MRPGRRRHRVSACEEDPRGILNHVADQRERERCIVENQPIGNTEIARQGVEHAREAHELLADAGPYRLDDATVERMLRVWAETLEWSGVYAEQGLRWHLQATDPTTEVAVAEYNALVEQERLLALEILEIARKLEAVTIEKLMAKSDMEIGLEALADPWLRAPGFGGPFTT